MRNSDQMTIGKTHATLPRKTCQRQRDERHREEQRLKSRKRVSERMLENREDGLNTKLSEAEPENKAWISYFDSFTVIPT